MGVFKLLPRFLFVTSVAVFAAACGEEVDQDIDGVDAAADAAKANDAAAVDSGKVVDASSPPDAAVPTDADVPPPPDGGKLPPKDGGATDGGKPGKDAGLPNKDAGPKLDGGPKIPLPDGGP